MRTNSHSLLRRLFALTLALTLVAGLTGCWFKEESDPTDESTPPAQQDTAPATTEAPTTEAPTTEAPTTEAPAEDTKPVQNTVMGTVTATKLNIRSGPDSGAGVVASYFKDDRIELLEIKDGWGRTAKGWVNMAYIKTDSDTTGTTTNNTQEKPTNKDEDKTTTSTTTSKDMVTDGKTAALGYGVVNLQSLNVRKGPGTDYDKVSTVSISERYAYYQKSGNWVRIDKGWISCSYFYIEGQTAEGAGNGVITGEGLNIRTGPGTGFGTNGTYKKDESVKILTQINGWGYTGKGWISMKYVKMDGTVTEGSKGKGTITADALNIRKSGSNTAEVIGKYNKNDVVEILEVKDGWGRTDKGWISMVYVDMDEASITSIYKTGKGTITATELNIRESGSKDSKALGLYKQGDKVEILEVKGEWGKTDKGWISLKYVKMD